MKHLHKMNRIDDNSYIAMVANRLNQGIEDVRIAFLQFGRDFQQIAISLHRCGTWM